jgi:hypothetical protein
MTPATIIFHALSKTKCCIIFPRQFFKQDRRNTKKTRTSIQIAFLTIFKNIGTTYHFNTNLKTNFTRKKSFLLKALPKTQKAPKSIDISRHFHFSPFSKTYVKSITLATFSKLNSLTNKFTFHLNPLQHIQTLSKDCKVT